MYLLFRLWNAPKKCKTKVPTGDACSEASKGKASSASPQLLLAPGILWLVAVQLQSLFQSSRGFLCVFSSVYSRTLVIGFRTYQDIQEIFILENRILYFLEIYIFYICILYFLRRKIPKYYPFILSLLQPS